MGFLLVTTAQEVSRSSERSISLLGNKTQLEGFLGNSRDLAGRYSNPHFNLEAGAWSRPSILVPLVDIGANEPDS